MSGYDITTGSTAVTRHVLLDPPHNFVEMHHYADDGSHYCPTGFAMCDGQHDPKCTATRKFQGECRLWAAGDSNDPDMTADEFMATAVTGIPVRLCKSRREYLIRRRVNRCVAWLGRFWFR